MFEQLQPEWGSRFSLRGAMLIAIAFGFVAGFDLGAAIVKVFFFHVDGMEIAMYLFSLVFPLTLAARFYSLALSRARATNSLAQD